MGASVTSLRPRVRLLLLASGASERIHSCAAIREAASGQIQRRDLDCQRPVTILLISFVRLHETMGGVTYSLRLRHRIMSSDEWLRWESLDQAGRRGWRRLG